MSTQIDDDLIYKQMSIISKNIRLFREDRGIPRSVFAEDIGYGEEYIASIERNSPDKRNASDRRINLKLLLKICSTYDMDIEYFVPKIHSVNKDTSKEISEINELLADCSQKQLGLIKKVVKDIVESV